jgi:hypothetical protein
MDQSTDTSGVRDFDFWMGSWEQRNRRRKEWLADCDEWIEFSSTTVAWPILDGLGNADELRTDFAGGFVGMSFRFFDLETRLWSIYWADSRHTGLLDPPVVGSFASGVGVFEGDDTFGERPIRVRYTWSRTDTETPRWEQAFSPDGGTTWETNWIMDATRVGEPAMAAGARPDRLVAARAR